MKSTISAVALVASFLPAVFASPLNMERYAEADYVNEVVTNVEVVTAFATVYATEGAPPVVTYTAPAAETTTVPADYGRGKGRNRSKYTWHQDTTTSTVAPPPPPPTTSSTPVEPAPTPSTTSTSETPAWTPPAFTPPAYTPPADTPAYVAPTSAVPVFSAPSAAPVYSAPQAPSAYEGDDAYSTTNIQLAILNSTNTFRAQYQAAPLTWNQSLADMAAASAGGCDWEHTNAGQNLAEGYGGPQGAVGGWMDEAKDYNFAKPDWNKDCGHLTQVIWQDTTTIGCAAKKCPGGAQSSAFGWFLICNYFPVGNMLGEFPQNIKPKAS